MEPVSIFSFAVNIIQLIDFGAKLLHEVHEIHQSATDHKAEHGALLQIPKTFRTIRDAVATIPAINNHELVVVIDKLRNRLSSLRRPWQGFRQALSTIWHAEEIGKLQKRLTELRHQLQSHMVTHVRYTIYLFVCIVQEGMVTVLPAVRDELRRMDSTPASSIDDLISDLSRLRVTSLDQDRLAE
ncbi:hypothetical protein P154DRAFT_574010 [Amniculicola lignicola CBS 123094]|uniref:NACHT-NTPase and P-loop NTPases N-terminal domain-containing protein n=1 Tax=Amniculicola lignicola CBS 123094 TaxID=1392246 RepID=A0A6A5WL69_9PLEO|nr:hypothetical protein P154DRAFT_574010 [Amniculicola lignicola CBS 123094]